MSDGLTPIVHIVDDDPAVREAIGMLLRTAGHVVDAHDGAPQFLARLQADQPGCVVTDLRMPGIDGLELQARMNATGSTLPVIVLTGHGDVPAAVRALKAGAVDFLEKPVEADVLLARVAEALERDRAVRAVRTFAAATAARLETLTPREREVLRRVAAGDANKVIAADLAISERTVELHRARALKKMQARSLPELTRMLGAVDGAAATRRATDDDAAPR